MLTQLLKTRVPKVVSSRLIKLLGVLMYLVAIVVWRMNVDG